MAGPVVDAKTLTMSLASDGYYYSNPTRWANVSPFSVTLSGASGSPQYRIRDAGGTQSNWIDVTGVPFTVAGNVLGSAPAFSPSLNAAPGSAQESVETVISAQGHTIQFKMTADSTPEASRVLSWTIGPYSGNWTVVTEEEEAVTYDWSPVNDPDNDPIIIGPTVTSYDASGVVAGRTIVITGETNAALGKYNTREALVIHGLKNGTSEKPILIRFNHEGDYPLDITNWQSIGANKQMLILQNQRNIEGNVATFDEDVQVCQNVILDGCARWNGAPDHADGPTRGIIIRASAIRFTVTAPAQWPTVGATYDFDGKTFTVRSVDQANNWIWMGSEVAEFGGARTMPESDSVDTTLAKLTGTGSASITVTDWRIDNPSHGLRLQGLPRDITVRGVHLDGGWDGGDFSNLVTGDNPTVSVRRGGLGIGIKVGSDQIKWRAGTTSANNYDSTPTAQFPWSEFISTNLTFEYIHAVQMCSEPMYLGCNVPTGGLPGNGSYWSVPVSGQVVRYCKFWYSGYDSINYKHSYALNTGAPGGTTVSPTGVRNDEIHDNEVWYCGNMYYTATAVDNLHIQANGITLGGIAHPLDIYNNKIVNSGFMGIQAFTKPVLAASLADVPASCTVRAWNNVIVRPSEHYGKYFASGEPAKGVGMSFNSGTNAIPMLVSVFHNTVVGSGSSAPDLTVQANRPTPYTTPCIQIGAACAAGSASWNNLTTNGAAGITLGGHTNSGGSLNNSNPATYPFVNYVSNDPDVLDLDLTASITAGIAGSLATDINGTARSLSAPTPGAYEYTP
jgi:hypothetical protein